MYYKELLLYIICLSVNAVSNSQSLTPTFIGVDYVGNNNVKQKMEIYIPEGLTSPAPVIGLSSSFDTYVQKFIKH